MSPAGLVFHVSGKGVHYDKSVFRRFEGSSRGPYAGEVRREGPVTLTITSGASDYHPGVTK